MRGAKASRDHYVVSEALFLNSSPSLVLFHKFQLPLTLQPLISISSAVRTLCSAWFLFPVSLGQSSERMITWLIVFFFSFHFSVTYSSSYYPTSKNMNFFHISLQFSNCLYHRANLATVIQSNDSWEIKSLKINYGQVGIKTLIWFYQITCNLHHNTMDSNLWSLIVHNLEPDCLGSNLTSLLTA